MANRSGDWLHQAEADLEHAQASIEDGDYEWSCFAAQQAAEKALKALYYALHGDPWGHSILAMIRGLPPGVLGTMHPELIDAAKALDKHYIQTRYPNGFDAGARFAAAVLTALALAITWLSAKSGGQTLWTYLMFGSMVAILANAIYPHVAISIATRSYMPGLATAVVVNLPVLSFLVASALAERQVSGWKAVAYSAGVPGLLLLSLPVLFKLGKALNR